VAGGRSTSACATTASASTAELLPQVFELFTQAERTPDRAQGGLGMGLALVKPWSRCTAAA
jgi:hypothetical protein